MFTHPTPDITRLKELLAMPAKYTIEKRLIAFWSHVNKNGPVPAHQPHLGECWLWTASITPHGYGAFNHKKTLGEKLVHRISYMLHVGDIPQGLGVLHKCDVRNCLRPDHLFTGTNADNTKDCKEKGRIATGERSSARLHPEAFPRGEQRKTSKLTNEKVREIRCKYAEAGGAALKFKENGGYAKKQVTCLTLAAEYGVSDHTICDIINYKRWKHVK